MRRWLPALLCGISILLWWMHPVLLDPTRLVLGDPGSEALVHLWGLGTATEGLWEHGPYMKVSQTGWYHGFEEHLMDPVSLLVFAPGTWVGGIALGWNLLHLVALVVGVAGCMLLAREIEGDPAVLVVGFCASTFMLSQPDFGRTEMLGALGLPLHLALLHMSLRRGSWKLAILAGVVLGLVANAGPYVAVFSLFVVVPVALAWGRRQPLVLGICGVPALLLALPPVLVLAANPVEAMSEATTYGGGSWDFVAQLRVPTGAERVQPLEQIAYVGLAGLGLGLLQWRRTWPWLLLALALLLFAPGPALVLGTLQLPGPVALLQHTPLSGIQHWNRIGCVLALPVAVAASIGWRRLPWMRLAWPVPVLLLVLDAATWPRIAPAPTSWDPAPPPELLALHDQLPEGALVHLPVDLKAGWNVQGRGEYMLWSLFHGRPVSARDHQVGDALADLWLMRRAIALQRGQLEPSVVTAEDVALTRRDAEYLRTRGAAALVFHADREDARRLKPLLWAALGEPPRSAGEISAWPLPELGLEPLVPVDHH